MLVRDAPPWRRQQQRCQSGKREGRPTARKGTCRQRTLWRASVFVRKEATVVCKARVGTLVMNQWLVVVCRLWAGKEDDRRLPRQTSGRLPQTFECRWRDVIRPPIDRTRDEGESAALVSPDYKTLPAASPLSLLILTLSHSVLSRKHHHLAIKIPCPPFNRPRSPPCLNHRPHQSFSPSTVLQHTPSEEASRPLLTHLQPQDPSRHLYTRSRPPQTA